MTLKATATIKREITTTVTLKREDILRAIENYVDGFDSPLNWEDIDWNFDWNFEGKVPIVPVDRAPISCTVTVVTIDNGEDD